MPHLLMIMVVAIDRVTDKCTHHVHALQPSCTHHGKHTHPNPPTQHQQGLSLLLDAGVFSCFDTYQAAVTNGELKAAQVIHNAGYSIDSLMLRYEVCTW